MHCWVMAIWSFFTFWPENGHRISNIGDRITDTDVILYSVQCCYAVHWTDNKLTVSANLSVRRDFLALSHDFIRDTVTVTTEDGAHSRSHGNLSSGHSWGQKGRNWRPKLETGRVRGSWDYQLRSGERCKFPWVVWAKPWLQCSLDSLRAQKTCLVAANVV